MNKLLIVIGIIAAAVIALLVLSPGNDPLDTAAITEPVDSSDADTLPANEPIAETPAPQAEPAGPTIVDLAVETESLSTLVTAVSEAGLVDVLASDGPFTVLAPQDSAFAALPEGTLDALLESENLEQLQAVLGNHVIAGAAVSTDLADGMTVTTLTGEELLVEVGDDGSITIGGATVVTADIEASNGVVHIIDTVIVPAE